uniref:Uncharacterized protein n=1 Tax=Nelumbo nucifera TaxID=4432 RepID=A0A822YY19_NELNU|nr:TPA_asm: hypothetical protein HUJ06_008088 [Nelumbo nucifera]
MRVCLLPISQYSRPSVDYDFCFLVFRSHILSEGDSTLFSEAIVAVGASQQNPPSVAFLVPILPSFFRPEKVVPFSQPRPSLPIVLHDFFFLLIEFVFRGLRFLVLETNVH